MPTRFQLFGCFGVSEVGRKKEVIVQEPRGHTVGTQTGAETPIKESADWNAPSPAPALRGASSPSPPSGTYRPPEDGVVQHDLDMCMERIRSQVKTWDKTSIIMVKQLQEALRNHGRVDLMRMEKEGGQQVAVKRMPTSWVRTGPKEFQEQYPSASEQPWFDMGMVRYLNDIGFPYACKLMGVFRSSDETFVVSSFCTEGDLFSWCDKESLPATGKDREQTMLPLVRQILSAVRYLHDLGIAHRDLSLENILLTQTKSGEKVIQVIDFGMSTLARTVRREVRGKQSYQAPEMHTESEYDTFLADIFALGVVVFAMAAQDYPWTSTKRNSCQLYEYVSTFGLRKFLEKRKVRKGTGEYLIQVLTPQLVEVVESMLQVQHRSRACLGESSLMTEATEDKPARKSVFDFAWLEGYKPPHGRNEN